MPKTIELPQVGESVVEGVISKWLKHPGDRVEKYEPLVEVVTDKVTLEVPSPFGGTLVRVLVQEGQTVPMGSAIAEMEVAGEAGSAPQAPTEEAERLRRIGTFVETVPSGGPTGAGEERAAPPVAEVEEERQRLSPVVRRLAKEHGVDLGRIQGTGLGGRITKEDVLAYVERAGKEGRPAAPAVAAPALAGPDEEAVPLTPVRRIIAENMTRSASQIPHAWTMYEVDVTGLVRRREAVKQEFLAREGVPLTYLPFVIKAVAESLKEHPYVNSRWGGDRILLKKRINIGIAVAAQEGLVVPVVRDADTLSIAGLAKRCHDLIERARQGTLKLEDVQGGTFTVNNTGALGSVVSYPLINYPQAAIITTEAITRRPVLREDDALVFRHMMNICLSFDHRILDGLGAAAFLGSVKARLEAMGPDTPIY